MDLSYFDIFFNGRVSPERISSFCFCHWRTSFRAASSASALQERNNSVGRLLKLVQKLRPSQPSSQGSSTSSKQFLRASSLTLVRHFWWNSSHIVDHSFVNILEQRFLHWLLFDVLWQQCHFAESNPTSSMRDTSFLLETAGVEGFMKHCQNCSCKRINNLTYFKNINKAYLLIRTCGNGAPHPPNSRSASISSKVVAFWSTSLQASLHLLLFDLLQQCKSANKNAILAF